VIVYFCIGSGRFKNPRRFTGSDAQERKNDKNPGKITESKFSHAEDYLLLIGR
jgi:hypothetical protein